MFSIYSLNFALLNHYTLSKVSLGVLISHFLCRSTPRCSAAPHELDLQTSKVEIRARLTTSPRALERRNPNVCDRPNDTNRQRQTGIAPRENSQEKQITTFLNFISYHPLSILAGYSKVISAQDNRICQCKSDTIN